MAMIDVHNHRSDLAAELAAAAPRRWWNKATSYLGAAMLLVGGFAAGAYVQREYGRPASPSAGRSTGVSGNAAAPFGRDSTGGANGSAEGGAGTSGGATGAGSAAGASSATTGTVKLVDGTTVYVETAEGDVVTVRTDGETTVASAKPSSLKDLAAGDKVTVQGSSSGEGTVTATSITATSATTK